MRQGYTNMKWQRHFRSAVSQRRGETTTGLSLEDQRCLEVLRTYDPIVRRVLKQAATAEWGRWPRRSRCEIISPKSISHSSRRNTAAPVSLSWIIRTKRRSFGVPRPLAFKAYEQYAVSLQLDAEGQPERFVVTGASSVTSQGASEADLVEAVTAVLKDGPEIDIDYGR